MSYSTGTGSLCLAIASFLLTLTGASLVAQSTLLEEAMRSGPERRTTAVEFLKKCHDPAWVESDEAWHSFSSAARKRINRRDATAFLERLPFAHPDDYRVIRSSGGVRSDYHVQISTPSNTRVSAQLHFREEDDAWKLFAASRYDLEQDRWQQINLEQLRVPSSALALAFTPDYDRLIEASLSVGERRFRERSESMAKMRTMSRSQFDTTWKVDVDFRNRTARSALEEILTEWGLGLNRLEGAEKGLSQRINLRLAEVSRFQVIEAICQKVELHPIYERGPIVRDGYFEFPASPLNRIKPGATWLVLPPHGSQGGSVTVAPGFRTTEIAFPGPFRVELEEIVERAPYASGSIRLSWTSAGLPKPRVNFSDIWRPELRGFELESSPSESARSVPRVGFDSDRWIEQGELINQRTSQRLEGLLNEVDQLNLTDGAMLLTLPAESIVQEIPLLEAGAGAGDGDRWVFIDKLQLSDSSNKSWIHFRFDRVTADETQFWAFDLEGRRLPSSYHDHRTNGRLHVEGRPSRIVVHFRRDGERLEYPFEFRNVPLDKHHRQPKQLPELSFPEAEAPLWIRIAQSKKTRFNSWELTLELENISNKDIVEAAFSPVEMEGGKRSDWLGQEIRIYRNRPETVASSWPDGHREILVKAGETSEIQKKVFEAYEFTEGMSALAVWVNFADESNWTFVARR